MVCEQSFGEQLLTNGEKGGEDVPSGGNSLSKVNKAGTHTSPIHRYMKHSISLGIQCRVFTSQEVFLSRSRWKNHAPELSFLAVCSRTGSLPELALAGKARPGRVGIGSSRSQVSVASPAATWTSPLYTSPCLFLKVAPRHPDSVDAGGRGPHELEPMEREA